MLNKLRKETKYIQYNKVSYRIWQLPMLYTVSFVLPQRTKISMLAVHCLMRSGLATHRDTQKAKSLTLYTYKCLSRTPHRTALLTLWPAKFVFVSCWCVGQSICVYLFVVLSNQIQEMASQFKECHLVEEFSHVSIPQQVFC